ncbi:hypothetical protein CLV72_110305 [Allonocardiopsis opalescens]|uniref:Uncharacterized protein n=1 Tax=Allonocardiopsis opalescens TaxID=1144618 RepID=A0A2T0PUG5_9ACTN|nr:hypothetical protein CLV72_110305 [Allonocardiopsis opalescens]
MSVTTTAAAYRGPVKSEGGDEDQDFTGRSGRGRPG